MIILRKHLLALSALSRVEFDRRTLRDQLPWFEVGLEEASGAGRYQYTVEQAFQIVVTDELNRSSWAKPDYQGAGRLVMSQWGAILKQADRLSETDPDRELWLFVPRRTETAEAVAAGEASPAELARLGYTANEVDFLREGRQPGAVGSISDLFLALKDRNDGELAGLGALNLSRAWRLLQARAKTHGIRIPEVPSFALEGK